MGEPVTDPEHLYFLVNLGSAADGSRKDVQRLRSVSKLTGLTLWQIEIEKASGLYAAPDESELMLVGREGHVSFIGKADGRVLRTFDFPGRSFGSGELTLVPRSNRENLITAGPGRIYVLSVETGRVLQEIVTPKPTSSLLLTSQGHLIAGDLSGAVTSIDLSNRKKNWKIKTGGTISSLSETENGILATSFDNYVYHYSRSSGKLLWKKRTANRIIKKPLIFDKYAVVVTLGGDSAEIINLENGRTVNRLILGENLYFVDSSGFLENLLIFQTSAGLAAFGRENCRND